MRCIIIYIYITGSVQLVLDFEAAAIYFGWWFFLGSLIDFFTFHFNIKPKEKAKHFPIKPNFSLIWANVIKGHTIKIH